MEWKWLSSVLEYFWTNRARIVLVLKRLRRHPFLVMTVFLFFAVILGWLSWRRSQAYENVVKRVLNVGGGGEGLPAVQNLLLANIAVNPKEDLRHVQLDSDFTSAWQQFEDAVRLDPNEASPATGSPSDHVTPEEGICLRSISTVGEVLTEKQSIEPGYLFLPYFLINPPLLREQEEEIFQQDFKLKMKKGSSAVAKECDTSESPDQVSSYPPNLYQDVYLTERASLGLQRLASVSLVNPGAPGSDYLAPTPVQIYLILSSGVTRIFIHDDVHPSVEFGDQFPATTFFPSRPYFWPTFLEHPSYYSQLARVPKSERTHDNLFFAIREGTQRISPTTTLGEYFRISNPYLDLGGSGIVVTLTRGIIVNGESRGVVCIDLRFDDTRNLVRTLERNISGLNAAMYQIECNVNSGSQQLDCKDPTPPGFWDRLWMWDWFRDSEDELSHEARSAFARHPTDVLGNLKRFDAGTKIRFSIPLNRKYHTDHTQSVTLLLASFDPESYKTHTSIVNLFFWAFVGLMLAYMLFCWTSDAVERANWESAMKEVDHVMRHSDGLYVHLDQDDRIIAASDAFVETFADVTIDKTTLKDLCYDDVSRDKYERVEEQRLQGAKVIPYSLNLKAKDGHPITKAVVSAAIPSYGKRHLPGTFGVFVSEEELGKILADPLHNEDDEPEST